MPGTLADRLPQFPWERLTPYARKADAHPGGRVDLSVGTPVDPVPPVVRDALVQAADWPGYPVTRGTDALREAAAGWMARVLGVTGEPGVLPVIGSKELVAGLPALLGIGKGDRVAYQVPAYPTYEIGALLVGAQPVPLPFGQLPGGLEDYAAPPRLLWLNSPANPHGQVLTVDELRAAVAWARKHDSVLVVDECYITLGWNEGEGAQPVSVLHPDVCDGDFTNLLALHSLSKRSNLAGYRAAFLAGDPKLLKELLLVRMHGGMMMPGPVQAAMAAALNDDAHAAEQKERYRARREVLRRALVDAGFRIDHSEAGLYLWTTRGEGCWDTVAALADLGILVAPGEFYGPGAEKHVRMALTATDERIAAAAERLATLR